MPRQKITETDAPTLADLAHELPELTTQQAKFVQGILAGRTATDAYRIAYDCSNSTNNTVWCEASKLRHHPSVAQWLSAARTAGLGSGVVTLAGHISELERLRELALDSGNIGAAVQAEQYRGKAQGLYIDQVRDITNEHDPLATLRMIAEIAGPEAAERLAKTHNIPFTPTQPEHKTVN